MNPLTKAYEEIALERLHICTGCDNRQHLSHSHLVPKAHDQVLKTVKKNIQYHCLINSRHDKSKGCHSIWESIEFWKLDDAEKNMRYIYSVRPDYFWLKLNHAIDAYTQQGTLVSKRDARYADVLHALEALESFKKIAA